jgi:hypothetical protein
MRKIKPKSEEEKRNKKKQLIVGGVLIFIMLASTIGYSFIGNPRENTDTNRIVYGGVEFVMENGFWTASINGLEFAFSYNPKETENISSNVFLTLSNYYEKPLYIYSKNFEAESEIYRNLYPIVLRSQYACPEGEDCEENWPVKTCEDNFIIIREANNTEIRQEDNCVFIQGNKEELARIADRFLFKITGVQ